MKRPDDYKMPKTLKRILSLSRFPSKDSKATYKNAMIDADIHYKDVKKRQATAKPNND